MSDVGYTDTPYGRCPIKSIRTLATPLITSLVQEFRHLSSSASCFRELRSSFFPFPFRSLDSGDGIRIVGERELDCQGGRSVSGGGAVHSRWFLDRLAAPDVTFRPQDGIGGWGIRGQVIIPGCLSRSLRGQRWITNGKRPCALPGGGCVMREGVD